MKTSRLSWMILGAAALLSSVGCQNYRDQLQRGQGYYEENQYEAALALFRHLEADRDSLSEHEVVRYCYLRGMTDFRLGYRSHARYWLGLAQSADVASDSSLTPEELKRLDETLSDLNVDVFGTGEESEESEAEEALGEKCKWTSDCDTGFTCQEGTCLQAESEEPSDSEEAEAPAASE